MEVPLKWEKIRIFAKSSGFPQRGARMRPSAQILFFALFPFFPFFQDEPT